MADRSTGRNNGRRRHFSLLDILIACLSVILAGSILISIFTLRESASIYYDREESLYYSLTDGDYAALAERFFDNGIGNEDDPNVKNVFDYYATGLYFEKAFYANALEKAGQPEKAQILRAQMEELEPQMGQFIVEKQKILRLFAP
ncbi:MAG: hypothetical protein Q4D81_04290 [Eubacteriales bacterium]|nr:hypothetical protein [Eubacteriales bacterium]